MQQWSAECHDATLALGIGPELWGSGRVPDLYSPIMEVVVRIGAGLETNGTVQQVVDRAKRIASTGVRSLWSSQIFGHDALTVLAIVGREVPDVEVGTAVIPVHPRHPMIL